MANSMRPGPSDDQFPRGVAPPGEGGRERREGS